MRGEATVVTTHALLPRCVGHLINRPGKFLFFFRKTFFSYFQGEKEEPFRSFLPPSEVRYTVWAGGIGSARPLPRWFFGATGAAEM